MSCSDSDKRKVNCVCEVLRAIKNIQDTAVEEECEVCGTDCFLEPLGELNPAKSRRPVDTRVFTLYTKKGELFKALFKDVLPGPDVCGRSVFFRVENIFDNCCATLRVLRAKGTSSEHPNLCDLTGFEATDSCLTVDLHCFCAVQCIADVDLGICI